MVSDKDGSLLIDVILDYSGWLKALETKKGSTTHLRHIRILRDFALYVIHQGLSWDGMFTFKTIKAFQADSGYKGVSGVLTALSDYLVSRGRIDRPFQLAKPKPPLPDVYEAYILYHIERLQSSPGLHTRIRGVLRPLHDYLEKRGIPLSRLKIEDCDAFLATFKVSDYSRKLYRSCLRGFLKYLYHEKCVAEGRP